MEEVRKRINNAGVKPDIIIITEVKPKNFRYALQEAEIQLEGYMLTMTNTEEGRGIAVYSDQDLNITEVEGTESFAEYCIIQLKISEGETLDIVAIYRSPSSSEENNNAMLNLLQHIDDRKPTNLLIAGDFNFPDINWENNGSTVSETSCSAKFVNQIQDYFWYQHVKQPTRARSGNEPSLLDLILTNVEDLIDNPVYESPLGGSDHCLITCNIRCGKYRENGNTFGFNWSKANYDKMRENLQLDWNLLLSGSLDVNEQWKIIHSHLQESIIKNVPLLKRNSKKRAKVPISPELREMIRKKHRTWQRYMETRDQLKLRDYKRARNKLKNALRVAKKKHEKDIADSVKSNPKKFWRYVGEKTKKKSQVPDLINNEGQRTTSNEEKAELLGSFFSSVMTVEPEGPLPQVEMKKNQYNWGEEITETQIREKLKELNPNKSQGPDKVHPRCLIEIKEQMIKPLQILFNTSLRTMQVPAEWKTAAITPVYKKGNKASCDNYRPVSLTSIVCKLLEKIIRDKIMGYLRKYELLSNKQYGFIPGRSTTLQLLKILDEWTSALDNGLAIETIYMDFRKAFDSVPHRRLIYKLEALGLENPILSWVASFLSNRSQYVQINGSRSKDYRVTSGIPQGSVLGPVLFVLYINDLPDNLKSNPYMFADDTKIFQIYPKDVATPRVIQDDLLKLDTWSSNWLLKFHPKKCHQVVINRKREEGQTSARYLPAGSGRLQLEQVECEKDLGITIDNNLTFEKHIDHICSKANQIMGLIRRTIDNLTPEIFKPLYIALVRSHLEYGQAVWSPFMRKSIKKIESVQRRATKAINGFKDLSYEQRLTRLNLPTLEFRRKRGDMMEVFKITRKIYDTECCPKLQLSNRIGRSHSLKLFKPQVNRLDLRKYSFTVRIVDTWNNLPEAVVSAPSLNAFKNRLDKHWKDDRSKFIFED